MNPEDRVGEVVPLGTELPAAPPPTPPPRLQGIAMVGLAVSALVGLLATIAFVSVSWPGGAGRVVGAVVACSMVSFLAWASIAIFAAAGANRRTPAPAEDNEKLDSEG